MSLCGGREHQILGEHNLQVHDLEECGKLGCNMVREFLRAVQTMPSSSSSAASGAAASDSRWKIYKKELKDALRDPIVCNKESSLLLWPHQGFLLGVGGVAVVGVLEREIQWSTSGELRPCSGASAAIISSVFQPNNNTILCVSLGCYIEFDSIIKVLIFACEAAIKSPVRVPECEMSAGIAGWGGDARGGKLLQLRLMELVLMCCGIYHWDVRIHSVLYICPILRSVEMQARESLYRTIG
ncbi:hypothetical protein DMENIID0001_079450 [Sergentomyia squamirostris]